MRRVKTRQALWRLAAWVAGIFTLAAALAVWDAFRSGSGLGAVIIAFSSMGAWEFWAQLRRMRRRPQNSQQREEEP